MELERNRYIITYEWRGKTKHATIYAYDKADATRLFNNAIPRCTILKCYMRPIKQFPPKSAPGQMGIDGLQTKVA